MAKTPATVLAEINQYIIANGVGAISGPVLNGVLQDIVDLVPPVPLDSGLMGYDSSGNPLAVTGGGGGSGLPTVSSIAALQALVGATTPTAYLDLGGRSGIFIWSSANHLTDVTYDPGQGVFVPVPSDITATLLVGGTISPNFTGTYAIAGTLNGQNYYASGAGNYIWSDGVGFWILNAVLGTATSADFYVQSTAAIPPTGPWAPQNGATGTAVISSGGGTSGAWVRQWNGTSDFAWWGAVADTVCTVDPVTWASTVASGTDNGQAFLNFQVWAQHQASLGLGVYVEPSYGVTGVYGWTLANGGGYWLSGCGTKSFHLNGRGLIQFQQLGTALSSLYCFPALTTVGWQSANAWLINSVGVGATVFTLLTASQVSNFAEGDWVALTSIDTQRQGYPPNPQNYQYAQVLAAILYASAVATSATYTSASGIFSLTFTVAPFGATVGTSLNGQPLTVTASGVTGLNSTWLISSTGTSGKVINLAATVGLGVLSPTGGTIAAVGAVTLAEPIESVHLSTNPDFNQSAVPVGAARATVMTDWPSKYILEAIQINLNPSPNSPNGSYVSLSCQYLTTIDWLGVGISETVCETYMHIRPQFKTGGETDKMCVTGTWLHPNSPRVGILLQSACPRNLNVIGGEIAGITGSSQKLLCQGVNINGSVTPGPQYGYGSSAVYDSCRIEGTNGTGTVLDGTGTLITGANALGGTWASYAAGRITLTLSGANQALWNVVPGMMIALQVLASDSQTLFPGNVGVAVILNVSQDTPTSPTYIYIDTNFPFTTLPTWANGNVWLFHLGEASFRECSGNAIIGLASMAYRRGKEYYNYYEQLFTGIYSFTGQFVLTGILVSVTCEAINPGAVSGATIAIKFFTYNSLSSFAPDTSGYTVLTFNIGVAGKRVVDTTQFLGKQTNDTLTVAGSAPSPLVLPPNRAIGLVCTYTMSGLPASDTAAPMFRLIIETDNGIVRTPLPTELFGGGTGIILPVQGAPGSLQ